LFCVHVSNQAQERIHHDTTDDLPRRESVPVSPLARNGRGDPSCLVPGRWEQPVVDETRGIESHKGTLDIALGLLVGEYVDVSCCERCAQVVR
jgi:hypothetical protein